MRTSSRRFRLLVCDLDNTLYDWVAYFVPAFYAMVDKAASIMRCDRDDLLDDFRCVHRKYHDSEHPFALLETQLVKKHFSGLALPDVQRQLDPALHAFNSVRKKTLKLHPGVDQALSLASEHRVTIVAHTESRLYAALGRVHRLGVEQYFKRIYCRERASSSHPDPEAAVTWLRKLSVDKVFELSQHQTKPDAKVLLEICSREGFCPDETLYIGDSIARDVLMAKKAGVVAVWAAYGAQHSAADYQKLVRISHWSAEDVEKEEKLREEAKEVDPDYVCRHSFYEILNILRMPFALPDTDEVRPQGEVDFGRGSAP